MLQCTTRISSHDLTHHSVIPYHNSHATSPDVATPQLTSLSILNYTATISPLPPRLSTSPPFRNTIPSTPSVFFFYISQVPSYFLAPWHTARHTPPASRLPGPGVCNSTSLWMEHVGAYSWGVEFSNGSFWPIENSAFVEALANSRL